MYFEEEIKVRWSDIDHNQHVRHSAYYDYGAHARIRFFKSIGFGSIELKDLQLGPILFKEECSFIKEIKLNDVVRVNLLRGDLYDDVSQWVLYHEIYNQMQEKVAHIKIQGAWMDTQFRKVVAPPNEIAEAMRILNRGEDYVYRKDQ